jgi:phosphopentomutase
MRAMILVMDSVGIGSEPDASVYDDAGADTVGHIAETCTRGEADSATRQGPLNVPHLVRLGLGEACRLASGQVPPGLDIRETEGHYGCAAELFKGNDTPSGHWELACVPVPFDWGYFPRTIPCFPDEIVTRLCEHAKLPGMLAERRSSRAWAMSISDRPSQSATHRPIASFKLQPMSRNSGWSGFMRSRDRT